MIAVIVQRSSIEKMLTHLGLEAKAGVKYKTDQRGLAGVGEPLKAKTGNS